MAIGGGMAPPFPVRVIEVAANYGSVLPNVSHARLSAPPGRWYNRAVMTSSVRLQLPTRRLTTDPNATALLSRLPADAVSCLLAELRGWLQEHRSRIISVHLGTVTEPETDNWTEAVFEVVVDADTEGAMALWDEIAARFDAVKKSLPEEQRLAVNRHIGVHLTWHIEA